MPGVGDWIMTVLQKIPSFTAMYLLVIYGMHDSILDLMSSGWCEPERGMDMADCGAGLIVFSFMAFVLLVITVVADCDRLGK